MPVTCSADNALPTQIELIPLGSLVLRDGRGEVGRLTRPDQVIASSMATAPSGVMPIDFDHAIDGKGSGDGRAAGWITGLTRKGDRIMASVEWTKLGAEALRDKTYRFISPTFYFETRGGEVSHIARAALTNNPALGELKQLASYQEEETMPKWLKEMASALGLADDADEATIAAAAGVAIGQVEHVGGIVTAAGLTGPLDEAKATAITVKVTAASETSGAAEPDPSKFVPMAMFASMQTQLNELTNSVANSTASQAVTAAMKSGKLTPAMGDWANGYAASDPAGFDAWLVNQPVIASAQGLIPALQPAAEAGALSAVEKAVCASSGISEEAFLATKTGKPLTKTEAK